ncbi:MAG TPA: dihydroorotate dehydrogenase-like protein [Terriglobia bacterium]|nr:dihydroorotate dehydrogenase-like protein [Terriglobia bacterium]
MNLTTSYMGLTLRNPLVASASPLNSRLDNIRLLEDNGAAAVVLPSIFEEQIEAEMERYDALTLAGAGSSPEAATYFPPPDTYRLGLEPYLDLISRATQAVEIPIIASLNGISSAGWTNYAKQIERAGAHAIELNVYFIPADFELTGQQVERRYLDILRAVRSVVTVPLAMKLSPYFSSFANVAKELDGEGADALVLFNRFYQPDIDLAQLRLLTDLSLSRPDEIRLPLLWIAILAGNVRASLAATTGVWSADEVTKYLLAGADVVMTTSALLERGASFVKALLEGLMSWLEAREVESLAAVRGLMSQRRVRDPIQFERANYIKILQGYGAPSH